MGVKTAALVPKHQSVPWLVLDGKYNEHAQQRAMDGFLVEALCAYYYKKPGHRDLKACHIRGFGDDSAVVGGTAGLVGRMTNYLRDLYDSVRIHVV